MAEPGIQSRDPSIRALSRGVADADDARIMRIVATVDAMAARGAADDLIASVRHRLCEMRPARPLRLARLLFLPLDPLIVGPAHWKPVHCTIPRTVISPMAEVVEMALGDKAASIKRAVHDRGTDQTDLISALGTMLWPEAAVILAASDVPVVWQQTGLGTQVYRDLARRLAALLSQASALDSLCAETAQGLLPPNRKVVEAMVRQVSAMDPTALPMLTTLLLTRLPTSVRLLYVIESGSKAAAIKAATDQAAALLLAQFDATEGAESLVAAATLAESGATAARIAALLNELGQDNAPQVRRNQVRGLRQRLDTDCKARFSTGLNEQLLIPLRELSAQPSAAALADLEATARGLRALEAEARTISGGSTYDKLLAQAADQVRACSNDGGLELTDQVRLMEILIGSDAALEMLDQARS
ncbi:hypothetical protein [Rhodopila sp.]|uniref:hypothetical protein n=1 Tax=Rhodopila sp. TaxID=2480087 RepID=UPI003D152572